MKKTHLILVSNDDGIDAKGIRELAKALKKIPHTQVVVVAPDREKSAASHALTLHRPLRIQKKSLGYYAVNGTPTDAVTLGVLKVLGEKPDLVVSGINRGANLGEDVHYSGTVAAAVEGATMGIPAVAISAVGIKDSIFRYEAAAEFAQRLVKKVLTTGLPPGVVLNVNVPSLAPHEIKGHMFTKLGKHNYGDVLVENIDPRGHPYFWIGGNPFHYEDGPGTDCQAQLEDKISITPLKVDMTDKTFLTQLKRWTF